ncbi:helix-turn-helix transcriptional regulator [Umezawaea tangerina]|uniref:Putative transcriptional regulator YheO n=1 Tax=Umezawaea tangerina TaxID=84725 RepID=A0A2T0SU32_9PSEU|nr:PAS domain-containing protein [Umezawaea tangerina]PRY36927.1 putative transcriptional regulator YheO [Umezawaea tangerina]
MDAVPPPDALAGLDAECVNRVLEILVAPLQAAAPQPTEVVLHDLRRVPNTVRAIAGTLTGRRVGDPPTDKLLERVAAGDLRHDIGYRTELPDGRVLRSSTIVYTDADGRPAAALCLNTDVSAWVSLRSAVDRFVLGRDVPEPRASSVPAEQQGESFPRSVDELCRVLVDAAIAAVGVPVAKMRKEQKLQVVAELERRGFFLVKQAPETAAGALGVSRFTIYNYLNELDGAAHEPA